MVTQKAVKAARNLLLFMLMNVKHNKYPCLLRSFARIRLSWLVKIKYYFPLTLWFMVQIYYCFVQSSLAVVRIFFCFARIRIHIKIEQGRHELISIINCKIKNLINKLFIFLYILKKLENFLFFHFIDYSVS